MTAEGAEAGSAAPAASATSAADGASAEAAVAAPAADAAATPAAAPAEVSVVQEVVNLDGGSSALAMVPPPSVVPPPQQFFDPAQALALEGQMGSVVPPPMAPPPPQKALVVGDENLLFTAGMQQAYTDIEFTAATVLSRQNLEFYNFDPVPPMLLGRVRHMVDPCRIGKHFRQHEFDHLILFMPSLSFQIPKELGSADRPLFAYRAHLFTFHVLRHAKLVLKTGGKVHIAWPQETGLMTSPCGAAGIEMAQLATFCSCVPTEPTFEFTRLPEGYLLPFLFGECNTEPPDWLHNSTILSYTMDKSPIALPLSAALLLHPDVGFVCIKDPSKEAGEPPGPGSPLRACLAHEAMCRKIKLKQIFGPKEPGKAVPDAYGLVPEPPDEESLLSIPMEIFMLSFDEVPHISLLLRFQVCDEQPPVSIASLDTLDPRLPTRIARPPPPKTPNPLTGMLNQLQGGRKRSRGDVPEEWGGMRFYCPLTRICTMTAERMRAHIAGDLYKKFAASTPGWQDSSDKKLLFELLEEAEEAEEHAKKARNAVSHAQGKGGHNQGGHHQGGHHGGWKGR